MITEIVECPHDLKERISDALANTLILVVQEVDQLDGALLNVW